MKIFIPAILMLLMFSFISYAQVSQEWIARYNGSENGYDGANSIAVDGSGNSYIAGTGFVTIKYNTSGQQQWIANYEGPANSEEYALSLTIDSLGNVYVTGSSGGINTDNDYATIKYNSAGIQQWVVRYNGSTNNEDVANKIAVDNFGSVYVTGYSTDTLYNRHYATIKYNSFGVQQWVANYNGGEARGLVIDGSGNVYVTGKSGGSGTGDDYATIKYNSSGVQQWVTRYNGPGNNTDVSNSITLDLSGNVYVNGFSSSGGSSYDITTIKYDNFGVQQWVSRYNGPLNSYGNYSPLLVDDFGNVYVTGYSTGEGTGLDYATVKYNSGGIQQWVARYNGLANSNDFPKAIALDMLGSVYVTGRSNGSGGINDYATIKYSTEGVQQWVQRYGGEGGTTDGGANSMAVLGTDVFITGASFGIGTNYDYVTIKYSQSVGINQINSNIPDKLNLSQNYPNPFNPTTNIEFSLPEKSIVKLKVFDITGKEVAELVNENLSPGTFRYEFNAENLPSGLYFCKFETNELSETKRMILIK